LIFISYVGAILRYKPVGLYRKMAPIFLSQFHNVYCRISDSFL